MFTKENAREYQLRSARKKALRTANRLLAMAKVEFNTETVEFEQRTLARVRLQLDKVYEQFMSERDPAKLDRLAAAQSRLSEQERILSGRPMPGSLRPRTEKTSRSRPSEPEPMPEDSETPAE